MENLNNFFLIFFCAICYALPFINNFFWPLLFIYYYLLYLILKKQFSCLILFLLSFFTFSIHLLALLESFQILAGSIGGIFAWFLLSSFVALNTTIFYYIISLILKKIDNIFLQKTFYILTIFLLIIWLDKFFLWPFGNLEGYCCFHPLVPSMSYDISRFFISYAGINLSTIFMLTCSVNFSKKLKIFFILLLFSLNFLTISKKSNHLEDIVSLSTKFDRISKKNIDAYGKEIFLCLKKINIKRPNVKLIVTPESTFPFALNKYPEILRLFQDALDEFKDNTTLILGSHNQIENSEKLYNSCYNINKLQIKDIYNKRHGLLFTERIPNICCNIKFFNNLFLKNKKLFSQNQSSNKIWQVSKISFTPMICSELFFLNSKQTSKNLILALVNDAWYNSTWLPQLLLNCAKLKSIAWQSDIIYVSHYYSLYITKNADKPIERFSI